MRARLQLSHGNLFSLGDGGLGQFDVVCCHGVLMYVPSLAAAVSALAAVGETGTLISTLSRNRAGIAMRAGMRGRWAEARAGFDASRYKNRLGVEDVRADDPEDVLRTTPKTSSLRSPPRAVGWLRGTAFGSSPITGISANRLTTSKPSSPPRKKPEDATRIERWPR